MYSPITFDALQVLDAIERKKSFAGAADELFRVPSAISYTVNKLEDDLGVALFDRSKRKAEFTAVGMLIVEQGRLILQFQPIYALIAQFQAKYSWIDIRVSEEMFGGTWDALNSGSCDLIIGAAGEPSNTSFKTHAIGHVEFVFAVARTHPLCAELQPISQKSIKKYPSVVVADSSKHLPGRSAGLLDGQARITVPSISKKIEAHLLGLGVGYLPIHRIEQELQTGQLVALTLAQPEDRSHDLCVAWCKDNKGKALAWFIDKIIKMEMNLFLRS